MRLIIAGRRHLIDAARKKHVSSARQMRVRYSRDTLATARGWDPPTP